MAHRDLGVGPARPITAMQCARSRHEVLGMWTGEPRDGLSAAFGDR